MKYTKILLLLLAFGMTAACSDDDSEKEDNRIVTEDGKTGVPEELLTEQERYQLACQSAVIGTLRTLTGLERIEGDVTSQTFEPAYGETLDGEGPTVRAVKCESTEGAEQSFRAIAGLDSDDAVRLLTATPDGYAFILKDLPILKNGKKFTLGTLTFHRDGGPRRYGWVDVDIPCIPHLERIDYLSPDAFPDNAGGDCPYQLGDIVWVPSGNGLCPGYYVCVANNGYHSTLVHMNQGKNPGGEESINFDGDDAGCWIPYNNRHGHATSFEDICDYVDFMVKNKGKVDNIKTFMNGLAINRKPSVSGMLHHLFPGHFNNDRGVAFYDRYESSGRIFYDAYYGDTYWIDGWIFSGWDYRHALYGSVPRDCSSSSEVSRCDKDYVYDSEWDKWIGSSVYTMNVIHARSIVSGSTLDYSPLNDPLYTKDTPPSDYTYYQFDVPSFEGAKWNSTLIKDVYVEDQWVAQVCHEYVPKINSNERITVVYPVYNDYPRYDKGFFPGDNSHKPTYVSWTDNGETVKTCEDLSVGKVSTLYVSADKVVTELPEDEWPYEATAIKDEYLHGLRCNGPGGSNAESDYPLVKIFNRVWTREDYCQAFADIYNDGRSVAVTMDGQNVTVAREYYPSANFTRASLFPTGWSVASATDFQNMYNILVNNGHSQPGYALLNGGVTGFEVCFVGWYDYGLNTWANGNLHMEYATKDLWHVGIRSDNGAFVIEYPFNETYWRMCIRLVKD
mgnify:CR=1 FL=1